jgi:phage terminase large subunit
MDFGYSNDPTAIVAIHKYNGGFILDEITYQKGLSNKQIADILINQDRKALCIADSAEPKSIDEIMSYGINILGSKKGQGSVLQGIQYVQDQRISVTKRSLNIQKEYNNFMWKIDKDGKIINEPEHQFKHAMDGISYGLNDLRPDEDYSFIITDSTPYRLDG